MLLAAVASPVNALPAQHWFIYREEAGCNESCLGQGATF